MASAILCSKDTRVNKTENHFSALMETSRVGKETVSIYICTYIHITF